MSLETGTYISDLVSTNPTGGDPKSQGDDHLRLIKSTVKATFPNVSGAVTGTHTAINDAVQRVLTSGTATASTSGTAINFTSIPSWAKRITVQFAGVSISGTSNIIVQLGTSGGVEAASYLGAAVNLSNALAVSGSLFTTGFGVTGAINAASVANGSLVVSLENASTNTWVASGSVAFSDSNGVSLSSGSKALSGTLERVRITTVGGSDTFDAGSVNILYE